MIPQGSASCPQSDVYTHTYTHSPRLPTLPHRKSHPILLILAPKFFLSLFITAMVQTLTTPTEFLLLVIIIQLMWQVFIAFPASSSSLDV